MKKHKPMTLVAMARSEECIKTAYVPATNVNTVAPMASMVRQKASKASRKVKPPRFCSQIKWHEQVDKGSTTRLRHGYGICNNKYSKSRISGQNCRAWLWAFLTYKTSGHGNTCCKSHSCNERVHYQMDLGCIFHDKNKSLSMAFRHLVDVVSFSLKFDIISEESSKFLWTTSLKCTLNVCKLSHVEQELVSV